MKVLEGFAEALKELFKQIGRTVRDAISDTPRTIRLSFLLFMATVAAVVLRSM